MRSPRTCSRTAARASSWPETGSPHRFTLLVCALNTHLGNTGKTVSYYETKDAALPSVSSLASLVSAMKAGAIQTLVVLGGNPVFDAPADLDFTSALAKVPHSIALGHAVDETSSKAEWHIPRAHYLESWGDARAVGGPLSVIQPLILPLFGGKTAVEVLGLMVSGVDRPGYDIVRDTWTPILGEAEFDTKWNRVLHDGLLPGSELPEVVPQLTATAHWLVLAEASAKAGDLELVFLPSPSLHDGRFANDGWLQELPDPLTKLTWDNPALLSPGTADTLGLANEDVVRVEHAGRSLELPVWILPGMADGVIAVTLGYGRSHAGRVGSGVGFDTYVVRSSQAPDFGGGVKLSKAGRTYALSSTQHHGSMEGRPLVRESTVTELRSKPEAGAEGKTGALGVFEEEESPHFSLWKEHTYDQGHQWGMTIDLNSCIGCNACMVACQSENNIPVVGKVQVAKGREMHWIRVDRYFSGEPSGNPEAVFQPVPCMQCEDAPCEQVCPVAATVHDAQGLNVMVYNRCIGTRYCSNNCPYKVRHFNFFNYTKDTPEILKLAMNPDVTVRARGVMEKCTYCTQRINRAKIDAKIAGRELADGDVKTACQQACPAQAIEFGDIRNKASRVATAKADPRNYALLDELNTRPRTTYLAKVRNPNPDLEGVRHDRPSPVRAGRPRARVRRRTQRMRARLHVEPSSHPSQSEHGRPAEGARPDGQRVLLRRLVHASARSGHDPDRGAEGRRGLLHGQGSRRAVRRDDPGARERGAGRARPPAVHDLLPAVPRRARRRQGDPVPARQRPDRLLPPGKDPEVPGRANLRHRHERRRADAGRTAGQSHPRTGGRSSPTCGSSNASGWQALRALPQK